MRIQSALLALTVFAYSTLISSAETDWIIELQTSDDLKTWSPLPIEAETLQDGRLRLRERAASEFFRIHLRTPMDVAAEKILAYIAAAGVGVPAPETQDFLDLGIAGLNPSDLAEVNSHLLDFQGQPGELAAYIQAKVDLLTLGDPAALAYAERTGLAGDPRTRLSSFLTEIREAGVQPVWLVLGRSEFLSLEDGVCRAVIGPDGLVLGEAQPSADGIEFDGVSGTRIEFPNPAKSAALTDFSVWCHGSHHDDTRRGALVSAYRNIADRGPELTYGGAPGFLLLEDQVSGFVSPGNTETTNRFSAMPQRITGVRKMSGWSFAGTAPQSVTGTTGNMRPFHIHKDLYTLSATNETPEFYNDGDVWVLGARPGGGNELVGEIDLAMACGHPLTTAQRDQFHAAALRHGIVSTSKPFALIAVGDSMTAGQAGGVSIRDARTAQLMARQASGWQGGIYTNEALSGQPIDVQEGLYATARDRLVRFAGTGIDRYIMFWGGYNISHVSWENETIRDSILNRYLAMAEDAAQHGISSIHWSKLLGSTGTTVDEHADWNAKYAAGVATLQAQYPAVQMIWYDHRLTYPTEFDGAARNEDFFVDSRHLSMLGQATLVADFISRFPAPLASAPDSP